MKSTLSGLFAPLKLDEEQAEDDESLSSYEDYASRQIDDDLKKQRKKGITFIDYSSLITFFCKLCVIFGLGFVFTYLAEQIVQDAKLPLLTVNLKSWKFEPPWPAIFGFVAVILGLSYRRMDTKYPLGAAPLRPSQSSKWQWISRYLAAFATLLLSMKKLLFISNSHSIVALVASSASIWYIFDRSRNGIILSTITSVLGSILYYNLVDTSKIELNGVEFPEIQFRLWIPMILFSASTIVGNAGRLLF